MHKSFVLRLLYLLGVLTVIPLGLLLTFSWFMHDLDPKGWDKGLVQLTGLQVTVAEASTSGTEPELNLTDDEKTRLQKVGKDPALVLRALQTEKWCVDKFGAAKCDAALYITLTSGESANCTNAGKGYAVAEARKRFGAEGEKQVAALREMLVWWKEADIRSDADSKAADYIPADYNIDGIKGSIGAGALGCSQFIPTTAIIHKDEIGKPFNLWKPDTAMKLMAAEIARLGYNRNSDVLTKVNVMLGWNQDRTWINSIINGAVALGSSIGNVKDLSGTQGAIVTAMPRLDTRTGSPSKQTDWQKSVLSALSFLGLGPSQAFIREAKAAEASKDTSKGGTVAAVSSSDGTWQLPLASSQQTSTCQDHIGRGSPCAWDVASFAGDSIRPTRDGTVTFAACGWNGGYGCRVSVDHGDGYVTFYSHMQEGSIAVKVGDKVTKSTVLGKEGSTGNSTGPHVDFVIQKNGVAIDPQTIFGSFAEAVARQKK